ncbi:MULTISPECIES: hypothetical protein [Enterobacteriaceae]|uniref:hypothetical protein n=1 Tax=Enterobacteriaceae TaxID=543 RepID=UPI00208DD95E|nr:MULTISPECIES: hypothetical protein [Enterobacteriaceae]MDM3312573.1 hypothetical protein [Citrobacter sp. Cb220]
MRESRDIELITDTQHLRQFPLDRARVARICKMTDSQANAIRDMNTEELQKQVFVTPVEFAYLTGRTLKSVRNLMDRAQLPVHREGMPGSKRPKRFIMLQEYWDAVAHCRALITPEEKHYIDRLMRDKKTYRRVTGNNHQTHKRTRHNPLSVSRTA